MTKTPLFVLCRTKSRSGFYVCETLGTVPSKMRFNSNFIFFLIVSIVLCNAVQLNVCNCDLEKNQSSTLFSLEKKNCDCWCDSNRIDHSSLAFKGIDTFQLLFFDFARFVLVFRNRSGFRFLFFRFCFFNSIELELQN